MKRIRQTILGCLALCAQVCVLTGCDEENIVYSGPDHVMFADSVQTIAIQNSTDYHDIIVCTMNTADHDRNFGVEVVAKKTNAIEGLHYEVESHTVTVKAGQRTAAFRVKGLYDNINDTDSLGLTLHLVNKDQTWDVYGDTARVTLRKVCPFNLDTFTGWCRVRSQYFNSYMTTTSERYVRTVKGEKENTVVLKNFFYDGYDLTLHLNSDEPLEPALELEDGQKIGTTGQAFGTIYGDGYLRMRSTSSATSFFNQCQHYAILYSTIYVEGVAAVGTYLTKLEWISDAEAEANGEK